MVAEVGCGGGHQGLSDNMTPLHLAPTGPSMFLGDGDSSMATQVLLEHGASFHIRNKNCHGQVTVSFNRLGSGAF